jgi:hypothetical protein
MSDAKLEKIAADRADWLLDAVATATQDRQFLRGDLAYNEWAGEAILLNGKKAILVAFDRAVKEAGPASDTITDLLAALEGLVEIVETTERRKAKGVGIAKAAIAKARGQA